MKVLLWGRHLLMGLCVCTVQTQSVQTFGRKKTAVAVAYVKRGTGLLKLNGEEHCKSRGGPS